MQNNELKALEIPKWGRYLRGKWLEYFASHLTDEEQKEIYIWIHFYGIYAVMKKRYVLKRKRQ